MTGSAIATFTTIAPPLAAQPHSPGGTLETALSLDTVTNGVATTRDGRIFLVLSRIDGSDGPRVVEWVSGTPRPYPEGTWNDWTEGKAASTGFVRVNALRVGPDGDLWIVDVGAPGIGNPKLPGGPKLVRIDLSANKVRRINDLDAATNDKSFIDDVRFNGRHAYVTDAGSPGLIRARPILAGWTTSRSGMPNEPNMSSASPTPRPHFRCLGEVVRSREQAIFDRSSRGHNR